MEFDDLSHRVSLELKSAMGRRRWLPFQPLHLASRRDAGVIARPIPAVALR